jgi:hypothetical protein
MQPRQLVNSLVGSDLDRDDGLDEAAAMRFVAGLGAAMASANYPVTMVRNTMVATSRAYGLDNQFLTLPNYVQVGTSRCDGRTYISHPDEDLRFDQTFPLATLIARAQTGAVTPVEGSAELDRIWGMAIFLPGAAITLAVAELSTRQMVSGSSRLVSGLMRIAQLAFGILIAAQVAGIAESNLVVTHVNRLGAWAPCAGIVVYGFGGGLVLVLCALAVAQRPNTLAAISLGLPG